MADQQIAAARARVRQGQVSAQPDPQATYDRLRQNGRPRARIQTPVERIEAKLDELLKRVAATESNMAKLNQRFDAFRTELLGEEEEGQADEQADVQADAQADAQADEPADEPADAQADEQIDAQAAAQADEPPTK